MGKNWKNIVMHIQYMARAVAWYPGVPLPKIHSQRPHCCDFWAKVIFSRSFVFDFESLLWAVYEKLRIILLINNSFNKF